MLSANSGTYYVLCVHEPRASAARLCECTLPGKFLAKTYQLEFMQTSHPRYIGACSAMQHKT